LRGACRYCHSGISALYPVVELLTAFLFAGIYVSLLPQVSLLYLLYVLIIGSIFMVIFFTDLKYGIIPFHVVIFGCIAVLTYLVYTFSVSVFINHILSAIGAFLVFFFLFFITKGRGMGFGDVVLVFLIGLFLGFPLVVFGLYAAFLTGAIVSLILILIGSKRLKNDTIPFGPFLVTGTFICVFFGDIITDFVGLYIPFF
jgi:prepilin signal peptidase PulO-like enzyme (type II secretory pathway)